MALVIVQPAMLSWMRGTRAIGDGVRQGFATLWKGFVLGARNMIGIGVACASAGLIVGAITLTGMGLMMTDLVELISAGNVLLMLVLTAVICLLIGAGVPTTANYILVATLMAPVIVELGARSELVIPLIAVHLFVFYFGIMADVTPPVGLASYAAAAISGADPNTTGWQATWYSMRTALLPFVFIFNPQILFIGVATWVDVVMVCISATVASLLFAAATMLWFRTRCTVLDVALLLAATFLFFRPDYVIDQFYPKYVNVPPSRIFEVAGDLKPDEWLVVSTVGTTIEGDDVKKMVAIPVGEGKDGREKIRSAGVTLVTLANELTIADVKFGSRARKLGVERGYKIVESKLPNPERPSQNWVFIAAALVAGRVVPAGLAQAQETGAGEGVTAPRFCRASRAFRVGFRSSRIMPDRRRRRFQEERRMRKQLWTRGLCAAVLALTVAPLAWAAGELLLVSGRWDNTVLVIDLGKAMDPANDGTPNAIVNRVRVTPDIDVKGSGVADTPASGQPVNVVLSPDRRYAYVVNHSGSVTPEARAKIPARPCRHRHDPRRREDARSRRTPAR